MFSGLSHLKSLWSLLQKFSYNYFNLSMCVYFQFPAATASLCLIRQVHYCFFLCKPWTSSPFLQMQKTRLSLFVIHFWILTQEWIPGHYHNTSSLQITSLPLTKIMRVLEKIRLAFSRKMVGTFCVWEGRKGHAMDITPYTKHCHFLQIWLSCGHFSRWKGTIKLKP